VLEVEVRSPHLLPARDSTAVSETTRPQAARDPEPALVWSKEASRHGVAPIACAHNRLAERATVARVPDAAGPSEETGAATRRDLLRCLCGCGSATAPARLRCRAVLRACGRPGCWSLAHRAQRSPPRAQGQGMRPFQQEHHAPAWACDPRASGGSLRTLRLHADQGGASGDHPAWGSLSPAGVSCWHVPQTPISPPHGAGCIMTAGASQHCSQI
jgi:hypothetical protein